MRNQDFEAELVFAQPMPVPANPMMQRTNTAVKHLFIADCGAFTNATEKPQRGWRGSPGPYFNTTNSASVPSAAPHFDEAPNAAQGGTVAAAIMQGDHGLAARPR